MKTCATAYRRSSPHPRCDEAQVGSSSQQGGGALLLRDVRDAGPRRVVALLRHAVRDRIEDKLAGGQTTVARERDRVSRASQQPSTSAAAPSWTSGVSCAG